MAAGVGVGLGLLTGCALCLGKFKFLPIRSCAGENPVALLIEVRIPSSTAGSNLFQSS